MTARPAFHRMRTFGLQQMLRLVRFLCLQVVIGATLHPTYLIAQSALAPHAPDAAPLLAFALSGTLTLAALRAVERHIP